MIPSPLSASLLWGSAYRIRKFFLFKIKMYKILSRVLSGEQGTVISMKPTEYLLFRGMTLSEDVLLHNCLFFLSCLPTLTYAGCIHCETYRIRWKVAAVYIQLLANRMLCRAFQQYRSAKRFGERNCIGSVVLLQRPVSIHRSPDSTEKHFHHSAQKDTKANDPYLSRNLLLTPHVLRIFLSN